MTSRLLEEVAMALAEGYPSPDTASTRRLLARVVEVALPSLALRASSVLNQGERGLEEVWQAIWQDSEGLFAPALAEVDRIKVVYVASKFANNRLIGHLMTRLAIDQALS